MFGSLRSLKPGQQGGGFTGKKTSGNIDAFSSGIGPAPRPALQQQSSRPANALEAAIHKQRAAAAAESRGKKESQHLPEWIAVNQRVGYLSSSGKVCEGFIDSISLEKSEVKFVFAHDENVWKRIQFTTIFSKFNPLRRLAVPGARSTTMTQVLNAAQQTDVDKSIMLSRIVGESAVIPGTGKKAGSEAGNSGSAAPEPGSAPGSAGSRSRSRSPRVVVMGTSPQNVEISPQKRGQQLPQWIAVGKRVLYLSKSGRYCAVDIETISADEVKIVFVADRQVWKGVPVSMILSQRNPLKPIGAESRSDQAVVDLDAGSDCSHDGSLSPKPVVATPIGPRRKSGTANLPEWIAVGNRVGYLSKSSGKKCLVEIADISMDKREVKVIFVNDQAVWKGIPFSMILSRDNPLRRVEATGRA